MNKIDDLTELRNTEIWKQLPIEGFERYYVSKDGRVCNSRTGRLLKTPENNVKYLQCCLHSDDGRVTVQNVGKLVAFAWIPNPDPDIYKEVNHLNCNRHDNRVENLEWQTRRGNLNETWQKNRIKAMRPYWNDPIWLESWKQKMKEGREKRYERMRNLERC